jgi:hypothetical protein
MPTRILGTEEAIYVLQGEVTSPPAWSTTRKEPSPTAYGSGPSFRSGGIIFWELTQGYWKRATYDGLRLREERVAWHDPGRAVCRALEAALKASLRVR